MGCSVNICSPVVLHVLQGDNLLQHGCLHRLQRNCCSGAWNTFSFFHLQGIYRAVSQTFFPHTAVQHFVLSLKFFPWGDAWWLRCLPVPCGGCIEVIWNQLCLSWGSSGLLSGWPNLSPFPHTCGAKTRAHKPHTEGKFTFQTLTD